MNDVNSSLVEQLLNITLAEPEAVVEPQGVPNHTRQKTVSTGIPVSYSSAAYSVDLPEPYRSIWDDYSLILHCFLSA